MITRKEKLLWLGYGIILVLLFLLSSTDLIIKEEKREIYPISVIVEDTSDINYVNFRKGMEQAAIERNADISFITLYEAGSASQQQELIAREQQAGASALIVAPAQGGEIPEDLSRLADIPVVMVWTGQEPEQAEALVTTDFAQMGRDMAGQIAQSYDRDIPVYLIGRTLKHEGTESFERTLEEELESRGFTICLFLEEDGNTYRTVLEQAISQEPKGAVIVGLDPDSLREAASVLKSDEKLRSYVRGLYGRGSAQEILEALDRGIIRGICATDEFSAGYLSVCRAVEAVSGQRPQKRTVLDHYYIEKKDLRRPKYETMLYPIE